ncbi:RING-1 like protein [Drechmeria coniospora]|uniref:RING-type E3 ubiquitin transferase n=1 Tax=Drechmeria coniospora TaxID=98403 RepID=A0A151GI78_DRECN|nr:RING-1 like protein [Drechmeria coniospora]KYK56825.1 RING-1 like protein [Drechmeria coniospora]ODA78353.1 hypothetical protein RJ55_05734 [Drechmeria coniospora]
MAAPALPSTSSPYPFASAPDIVRAHQKDAYFTGYLANTLTDLHRHLLGARATHAVAPELRSLASLLYFSVTTLPGNRTLGEEYCDLVQVESPTGRLPAFNARAAYVAGTIVLPYLISRCLPALRARIRTLVERRLDTLRRRGADTSREARIWGYMARHLTSLTSAAPIQAVTLALFYFNGTYYELTKRLLSLRYVFTRTVPDSPDRAGYEVLGVLLVIQLVVQAYLHLRSTISSASAPNTSVAELRERPAFHSDTVDVSLNHNSYAANSDLLLNGIGGPGPQPSRVNLATTTHTPSAAVPRFNLADSRVMSYIKGAQQRKCTLCLEELKDPSATPCGHVFCWECIGDWVREKPECPLCRREATMQHILPLRVM